MSNSLTPRQSQALVQAATVNVAELTDFATSTLRSLVNRGLLVQLDANFHQVGGYRITLAGVARVQAFSPLTPIADANLPVASPAPTADEILHLIDNPPTVAELSERRRSAKAPVEYLLQYVRPNYGANSHQVDAPIAILGTELRDGKTVVWYRFTRNGETSIGYRPVSFFTRTHPTLGEHYVAVDGQRRPQAPAAPSIERGEFARGDVLSASLGAARGTCFVIVAVGQRGMVLRNVDTGKVIGGTMFDFARGMIRVEDVAYADYGQHILRVRQAVRDLGAEGIRTASQFLRALRETARFDEVERKFHAELLGETDEEVAAIEAAAERFADQD